ncbi:hypothetical protein VaNZ11_016027 [Volvox africanus]|uniref:Protein kinase domain-containing protein n=1 Tax=Volvox africanus TaxID=51714 RepID=A0ABQ5SND5_9CHLO|nr:hypothetical protein VaNZ11_016027 [Volvox africanus]
MITFCCFGEKQRSLTAESHRGKPEAIELAERGETQLHGSVHGNASHSISFFSKLPSKPLIPQVSPLCHQDALLQLLSVLTSLDGGWWDQVDRALGATAQHLSAAHACVFLISGDSSYASPLALVGPPAPPLCIGTPLPLVTGTGMGPAAAATCHSAAAAVTSPPSGDVAAQAAGAGASAVGVAAVAAAAAGSTSGAPSCAAAMLLAEQDNGRLLRYMDVEEPGKSRGGSARGRGRQGCLPPSAPQEWRYLSIGKEPVEQMAAAADAEVAETGASSRQHRSGSYRHFAAVVIPAGNQSLGTLSLGAEGPGRPASWTPEVLHCTAAMLSSTLKLPQVDLACRALSELSSASTIHQLVRTLLGAASELVVTVTRIETQARVAFLLPDLGAAAIFQSAATDALGPSVRRRLSEVLLVDMAAPALSGGGGGGGGSLLGVLGGLLLGGARSSRTTACSATPVPIRSSLGGTEAAMSRTPSIAGAGVHVDAHRDSFGRGAHQPISEEVSVCRGHSLPLKHTLLSEALAQGTGLCISDCNAYVQDSKIYPRDLAVSRGAAPAQSLALATSCHGGRPLLALYATYHSILPQALLQTVVQELGQLLRALTASVAAKVEGALSAEWGYLRHQLLESMWNRSLRRGSASGSTQNPGMAATQTTSGADAAADAAGGHIPHCDSSIGRATSDATAVTAVAAACGTNGGGARASLMQGAGGGTLCDIPTHPRSSAASLGVLHNLAPAGDGSGAVGTNCSTGSLGLERSKGGGAGGAIGRDGRTSRRASFSLEAANSPRGSSKLAPLMATLHDRLKAAQAEQMANCRAASRMQDLESIRILEQIGRGGYGVVYRGLYHGSEVAIKVIQEVEVAAPGASGNPKGGGADGGLRRMNSVALENKHLHDAIELVAAMGMGGHPNIVQVLTFFTDVRVVVGDEPMDTLDRRLSGLDGVGELLRLTRMPSILDSLKKQPQQDEEQLQPPPPPPLQQQQQQQRTEVNGARPGGGVIVLVQEFCDAGTLKNAINQRAFYRNVIPVSEDLKSRSGHLQLNLKAVYSTLLEVALALRHMHGLLMVHCDLKPQNVLLKSSPRDPRGFTAKLSDFGLAKMMEHDEEGQLVIDEGVASGTLTHMAPESLAGQKQLNASIDMYAFGILMWQMVCGTRLYQGLNAKQIIRGVVREKLRPMFPAWVPQEYRRLAERCWHPTPSERPTASVVVAELEAMVDNCSRSSTSAAATVATTAAAAAAAAWRPPRISSHGPASFLDPPGSPLLHPSHQHAHAHAQQMQHLQQRQQLHQLQQQHQQQHQVAAAAGAGLYTSLPGSKAGPMQSPRRHQHQQQQQQQLLQQKMDGVPHVVASLRGGSQTGMGPSAGPPGLGLGPGRLII